MRPLQNLVGGILQYINLVLVALTFLIVWPPAAYVVLALAAGALLSEESAQPAARDHRRRSIQGRRRSLQEPEWLRQAAASLLLPADSADPASLVAHVLHKFEIERAEMATAEIVEIEA